MGQSTYMELDHSQNPGPNYESLDQNQDHDQQMIANQSSNTGIGQFNDPDTVYEGLDRNQDHDRHIYLGLDKKKWLKMYNSVPDCANFWAKIMEFDKTF